MEFSLSSDIVTLVVTLLIPLVTGLLTKSTLSSAAKGLVLLVLNAVNAFVIENVVADTGWFVVDDASLKAFAISLAISVAAYAGVYKPLKLTSHEDGKLAPHKGLG